MKKLNKLIPIISVVGASVVSPITISSCHPEYVRPMKMYDLTKEYEEETDPISAGVQYNQTEATLRYITDVRENSQIFIDDACLAAQELIKGVDGVLAFDFGISEPKFGLTTISHYGGEDTTYSTITCEQRIHYERFDMENNSTKKVLSIDLNVWYKDVVFYAYENGWDEGGGWNLGLFDYNVGSEAYWPFISNTRPWSISYSCKTKLSTYHVTAESETLLNNHCSYYSANVDNGTTLINLLKRYGDPDIEELEKVVLGIILIDYHSNYLKQVDNRPEIALSYVLQSNYAGSLSLELNGLILILPSYMKEKDGLKSLKITSGIEYTISAESSPLGQRNSITIPNDRQIAPTSLKKITEYRYEMPIVGDLEMIWTVPPGTNVSMYLTCPDPVISIEIVYLNSHTQKTYHYTQKVNLKYNYIIHSVVSNN